MITTSLLANNRLTSLFPTDKVLFILNSQGIIENCSENITTLLDYLAIELIGQSLFTLVHTDDKTQAHQQWDIIAPQTKVELDLRCRAKSGDYRWLKWKLRLSDDKLYATAKDITPRKTLIHTLTTFAADIQHEANLAKLNDYEAIRQWDLTTHHIQWDTNSLVLLGYKTIEPNMSWWANKIHTDDKERVLQSWQRFIKGNERYWIEEYRFQHADSTYLTIIDKVSLIRDANQQPIQALGVMANAELRKQLKAVLQPLYNAKQTASHSEDTLAELQYQSQLIKTITDNTTSGLFMMDAKGHPIFMNPAAEKITGYKLDEIKNRPLHYAIHYKRPDGTYYPMEECPLDNSSAALVAMQNQEEVFVDKFGRLFPVIWSTAPIARDNKTVGAVIEFRDVTLEKQAEKERLTAQLQVEQQTIKANLADQHRLSLARFMDYLCHEIRNPLQGISGNAALLEDTFIALASHLTNPSSKDISPLLTQVKEGLANIFTCTSHQAAILNSVLDYSKLQAGMAQLNFSIFSLQDLLQSTLNMKKAEAELKQITLTVKPLANDTLVKGDFIKIRQILINLLSNAIKFTPSQGCVQLQIDEIRVQSAHILLSFSLSDNGVGMTPEEKEQLFQRFYQANAKISSQYEGSGLGLSICHELVKLMGGNIEVETEKNKGTCFKFTIQCHQPSVQEQTDFTDIHSPKTSKVISKQFRHILIVEDNLINQKVMAKHIAKLGYSYTMANNGQEAVAHYKTHAIDLILMDIQMPIMNGYQATEEIRQLEPYHKSVVIIGVSGNAREEHINEALAKGMDDYVTKPCGAKELAAMIQKWETRVAAKAMQRFGFLASTKEQNEPSADKVPRLKDVPEKQQPK